MCAIRVPEGDHADLVAEILRRGNQYPYALTASQTALGEAAAVILRDGPDAGGMLRGMLGRLADSRIDPGRCMPPLSPRVLGLDTTDTVMTAHTVADPNSAYLITRDSKLVANSAIEHYEEAAKAQGHRKTKLEIINPVETFPVFGAR